MRQNNKQIIEVDWTWDIDPDLVGRRRPTYNAAPRTTASGRQQFLFFSVTQQQDEDREPSPARPVAPAAPQSELQLARVQARDEEPQSRAFCQNDPILKSVFSCPNFAKAVTVFRVAHRNDDRAKEPLDRVLKDPNFACTACVTGPQVVADVNHRAMADKLNGKVQTCLYRTLEKTLNDNIHEIHALDRFYKESVSTCSQ